MRRFAALLAVGCFSVEVMAVSLDEASPVLGVWRGTIGDKHVAVCFGRADSTYYYLRHFWALPLSAHDSTGHAWTEGNIEKPTGAWKLASISSSLLQGQWSDPKAKRTLPIQLTRIKVTPNTQAHCTAPNVRRVFNSPRVDNQPIAPDDAQEFSGRHYRKISTLAGRIATIELLDGGTAIATINSALRDRLRDGIADYFDNDTNAELAKAGREADSNFGQEIAFTFWNDHWLSMVESSSWDSANGPHGRAEYLTWDLSNGKKVNLWTWLKHIKSGGEFLAPEGLNALIASQRHDVCSTIDGRYQLGLSPKGIVFTTPEYGRGLCVDSVEIPYRTLHRFLTPTGKEAMKSINPEASK